MSQIRLLHVSCADQIADAVVNAANNRLLAGGGICGVIFRKAGALQLREACSQFDTPLQDGSAVITPAFQMRNAKFIIHAVGPNFGRTPQAFEALQDAYYNSLCRLWENQLRSISFPLISAGIYGGALAHPAAESAKQCILAYRRFTAEHPEWDVEVRLCAFSEGEMREALGVFEEMGEMREV